MQLSDSSRIRDVVARQPILGSEVAALVAALGVGDGDVVVTLYAHGLRAHTVPLLEWLPAVDVCWLDGADAAERHALRVQYAADDRSTVDGVELIERWLTERPPVRLFEAGRRALRARLAALDLDAREAMLATVVARCEAAGRAGGGGFGIGSLSFVERDRISQLRKDLEIVN
ncbi:MAG: hypothetical protein U0P30_14535 [Vicinamibacterales bacterium]